MEKIDDYLKLLGAKLCLKCNEIFVGEACPLCSKVKALREISQDEEGDE